MSGLPRVRRCRSGLAFVALLASSLPALASPSQRSGFGSRSHALAGAEIGDARGAPAVFENPAALVQAPDTELSLGTSFTSYDFAIDGRDAGLTPVHTLDFGVVIPGSLLTIPIAFGLALSLPDGRFSKLHNADPTLAYFPLDDPGPRLFDLGMALALRPVRWLAVGGGVGFLAAARGGFQVTGTAVAATGGGSEYESDLRHSVAADLISVRYPVFGATLTPSKTVVLGALFRGSATIEQKVSGELGDTLSIDGTDIPVRYRFETRARLAFLPRVIAVGGTARPASDWRVSAQLDWEAWSAYPSPFAQPKTTLEIEPPPGITIMPPAAAAPPAGVAFDDRFVPRIGVEKAFEIRRKVELLARAGYAYEAAVAPARQAQTFLVDLDRHVVAVGVGSVWRRPFAPFAELRLDVHASLTQGVERGVESGSAGEHRVSARLFGAGAALGLAFDALGRSLEPFSERGADFPVELAE